MLKKEYFTKNGIELVRNYSDEGFKILQNETEIIYDEAIDLVTSDFTYTETDIPIEDEETDEKIEE